MIILQTFSGYRLPTATIAVFYMHVLKAHICASRSSRDVLGKMNVNIVCVDRYLRFMRYYLLVTCKHKLVATSTSKDLFS